MHIKNIPHQDDTTITRRYIYLLDSFGCRVDTCMRLKILWNLIMDQLLESHPVNAPMSVTLREHLLVALNRTIFEHNSGKIADHVSAQGQAALLRYHAVSPIFCMPTNKCIRKLMVKDLVQPEKDEFILPETLVSNHHYQQYFHSG